MKAVTYPLFIGGTRSGKISMSAVVVQIFECVPTRQSMASMTMTMKCMQVQYEQQLGIV